MDDGHFPYAPSTAATAAHVTPVVRATAESLAGYGRLVEDPDKVSIEIVRWPAQGWRPVDDHSGDQGGVVEGAFDVEWRGDTLYGRNAAVGDSYLFAWSVSPAEARAEGPTQSRTQALMWRANYHPDGGQMVFPLAGEAFLASLALPGDDVRPESFVTFRVDGGRGLYIPPGVWHGPFIPLADRARLLDRQGRVHARVSVDFVKEFGVFLAAPLET
jgi:ureidoglycolate lyase